MSPTAGGFQRVHPWDGEGYFAIDYTPGVLDDPRRNLVKALKAGDRGASATAAVLLVRAVAQSPRGGPVSLVAVPGHSAGPNLITEELCARIAAMLPWSRRRFGLIERSRTIRRSATALHRPSIDEHLASMRVTGPISGSVIIVDDVFTHGRITEACREILRDAGGSEIIVAAVARTRLQESGSFSAAIGTSVSDR